MHVLPAYVQRAISLAEMSTWDVPLLALKLGWTWGSTQKPTNMSHVVLGKHVILSGAHVFRLWRFAHIFHHTTCEAFGIEC